MQYPYGKNVLVTGASSGIGLASCQLLSKNGFTVWGVSRSGKPREQIIESETIRFSSMDVTNEVSVQNAVQTIWKEAVRETGKGIFIVLHCAGMGIGGPAEDTEQEKAEQQVNSNYFGVLRVNRNLLPLMRSQKHSLVLVIGSIAGRISIPYQSHYSSSKFALEAYIEALRMEGRQFGIQATIIEPGDTKTNFTASRKMAVSPTSPYFEQANKTVGKMERDENNGASPDSVAKVVLKLTRKKNPPIRKAVGITYKLLLFLKRILPDKAVEFILMKMYL
ncbi:SDR family oxidoreductase [uncultured Sphaerochaeta sp.]|uniref:SDR family oxidoreductase n=1 Tax=uncultured Sphaerochaeta sp. TaxID=886478 RepID=UPI002A0A6716|nr:SDR family oxidoreductase [uncultured Sphaerochaeta sp.]